MKRWNRPLLMVCALFIFSSIILLASDGVARDFPRKPITVIVSWPAGSSTGFTGQKLVNIINQNKFLPQPMQMLFKPGGAGTIGLAEVLQGKADGYTIAYNPSAPIIVQPLVKDLPYTHRTLTAIVQTIRFPWLFVAKGDAPWKNMPEFLTYAKQNPGEALVATGGDYTWGHVALLDLMRASGIKFRHVPLQGDAGVVTAVLGGHVLVAVTTAGTVSTQVAAGKLRYLATVEPERPPFAPDIPTVRELGYNVRGTTHTHIVAAPKATPPEIVEVLHDAFKKAIATDDFLAFMKDTGGSPGYVGYQDLPALIDSVVKDTAQLLEGIGVKVRKVE